VCLASAVVNRDADALQYGISLRKPEFYADVPASLHR